MFSDMFKNINEDWRIGDPAKVCNDGTSVYGRFYGNDTNSSYYGDKYAVIFLITPGGTVVRTGRAHMEKLTGDDIENLKYWERKQMMREDYMGLYANQLVLKDGSWVVGKNVGFKNAEMQYQIMGDVVKINLRIKRIPIEKYFKGAVYNEKLNKDIVEDIINDSLKSLHGEYGEYIILNISINGNIEITIKNPQNDDKLEALISSVQGRLRNFYEENEVHITRMFGSYILLEKQSGNLKATKATRIPIKHCPLMIKLLKEVGGQTAGSLLETLDVEDEKLQTKMMCNLINEIVIKGGYFDTDRPLNSCEANVLFGASETIASAFETKLVDAAVIVSNNLGTIITTDASNTQGAVKRMTGLFYTSPSSNMMKIAKEANIIPVFPYTAEIDQLVGVEKAISLGYKRIAVSLAAGDNYLHQKLRELEIQNEVTIYKFGLCSTGIDEETAHIMWEYADVVWSCASKAVRKHIEPKAIAQVGVKIPVHIMTKNGWLLVKNHLEHLKNSIDFNNIELQVGENKPVFINEEKSIKVLSKKNVHNCLDCPHPCI